MTQAISDILRAKRRGVPLIALQTQDQPAAAAALTDAVNAITGESPMPLIQWDLVRGHLALNEPGQAALARLLEGIEPMSLPMTNVTEMLARALTMPPATDQVQGAILIVHNAWRYLDEPGPVQALLNLRDQYKASGCTLLLLGPDFRLPPELAQDVLVIDDPLPTPEAIGAILSAFWSGNGIESSPELLARSTGALRGLAAFPAEQASALSVKRKAGALYVDQAELWNRKRSMVNQTRGLSMLTPRFRFSDVGGQDAWKQFHTGIQAGPEPYSCVVWLDEIEKAMAGSGGQGFGDSSGVSQDQLGTILTEMELNDLVGTTLVGPAGSGKSLLAESTAASFDIPLFRMDLGAAKNMYVGQSEAAIRAIMRTIIAIGGRDCLFVATCNGIQELPAALRRRLGVLGVWFVDLPDQAERAAIATIQVARFGLKDKKAVAFFRSSEGWSGANIRDCCRGAYKRQCSVADAAQFIVPASVQEGDALNRLRNSAAGRFLSTAYPGMYHLPSDVPVQPERKLRTLGIIAEVEESAPNKPDPSKLN